MAYDCKIIAHSVSEGEKELVTFQVTFPRIVLAEFRTHRSLSEDDEAETYFRGLDDAGRSLSLNAASSRAIPVSKMIQQVLDDPFIPIYWGKNQRGMQAQEEMSLEEQKHAERLWLQQRNESVRAVRQLSGERAIGYLDKHDNYKEITLDVHKQIANRLLEPFSWTTVVVSGTEWSNFFAQRCDKDAQPEIKKIADMMRETLHASSWVNLKQGEWHLPYVQEDEASLSLDQRKALSVARCARVSYLSQEGVRDHAKDYQLFDRLRVGNHWSPFEHVATPLEDPELTSGNFRGWFQFRKAFPQECR